MKTLLLIDASVRRLDNPVESHNSISKKMGRHFMELWMNKNQEDVFIHRDLSECSPEFISQGWIEAVFTSKEKRTDEQHKILEMSDTLIEEVRKADIIVMTTPMYNYGMPASLKAWFDQVVRIQETFTFDLSRGDFPLEPVFSGKTLVLLNSCGEFGFDKGGIRELMNHLGPHIKVLSQYLGVENFHEIRIEYQEFNDHRHVESIVNARQAIASLVEKIG
jgi:FMN-dependent NADH-azoreductase